MIVLTLSDKSVTICQVFFYKGELHIIPLSKSQEKEYDPSAANLTISQALTLLSSHSEEFLAAEPIRTAVYKRISGYVGVLFWSSAAVSFDSGLSGILPCIKYFSVRCDKVASF